MFGQWKPYVPVGQRRQKAAGEQARLAAAGQSTSPVIIKGRAIASTPWGKAWCEHLERYSDYANRLPRGRTYVRNGSVFDLQITPGQVVARVSGSSIYRTSITVQPVPGAKWRQICADCAGGIDSVVELLRGRLAKSVMDRLCRQDDGLFPAPRDIRFDCSCPDSAAMCKHVAAVLYGVGARLDHQPELLFTLRQVDAADLLSQAGTGVVTAAGVGERTLAEDDLGALFGLDMDPASALGAPTPPAPPAPRTPPTPPTPRNPAVPATPRKAPAKRPPEVPAKRALSSEPKRLSGRSTARARNPAARLLEALRRTGWLDNAAARAATGLDADAVRPLLRQLVADGHARVEGQKRGTRYVAVEPGSAGAATVATPLP
jgi:uncharacterized Zn finger protein